MVTLEDKLSVIPRPTRCSIGTGSLRLKEATISASSGFEFEGDQLGTVLSAVGVPRAEGGTPIVFERVAADRLGREGYILQVRTDGIVIEASEPAGAFYAVQTLRQLLPLSDASVKGTVSIPVVEIEDQPRFGWRGLMFDVSRHFYSVDEIKGILDILGYHKMNVFHWHLVDDGGWRIEIKRYPLLTQRGAWRLQKEFLWDYLDIEFPAPGEGKDVYGGFYTQDEIREIVAYAARRHITVVPEIEMPGHSLAALWSYPALACTPDAVEKFREEIGMRESNVYCAGKEETFEFLSGVLAEVMELFPSEHIHIGGDEVFKILFENCSDCRRRMEEERLESVDELQSYFVQRVEKFINSHGRVLVGWDEILQGGLAPNAVVMSWRGTQGGIDAARAGHDVIMTPYSHCYFDFGYDQSPTPHVLEFKPVPEEMTPEEASHVLGGQANLWTEYVPDLETVHRMMLPRLASMTEILWSGKPELAEFERRLASYKERLLSMGLQWMEDETTRVPQHHEQQ